MCTFIHNNVKHFINSLDFLYNTTLKKHYNKLYIFATQCRTPWIFQTMNSVRSNNEISHVYNSRFQRYRDQN